MSEQISITIDTILSVFKNARDAKRLKEIKTAVINTLFPDVLLLAPDIEAEVYAQVENAIKLDKVKGDESRLKYKDGKYKKRPLTTAPQNPEGDVDHIGTEYTGRAGELAVMSELMFRGYNANRMMIDDGVDIIAVKDNIYYYIQVKTTTIRNGRVYQKIGFSGFNKYINSQIRYILVARYKDHGVDRNMYFVFSSDDIERLVHGRCISRGESGFNLKIKFNEFNSNPIIYDERESDISWNLNKFDL